MLNYVKRSWKGEIPLWQAFWLWGVVGNGVWITLPLKCDNLLFFIFEFIYLPISLYLIWKSQSKKTLPAIQKIYIQLTLAIGLLGWFSLGIFIPAWIWFWGSSKSLNYLELFFQCK